MTLISIPLQIGNNYISFPATSTDNFLTIFTSSTIINNITQFSKFNSVLQQFQVVLYTDHIEEGVGYFITVSAQSVIVYDGPEYTLQFADINSMIVKGWNLVGPGSMSIQFPAYCKVTDPITGFSVTQLFPTHAYWINSDSCQISLEGIYTGLAIISTGLIIYLIVKGKY